MPTTIKLRVPACWRRLIGIEFAREGGPGSDLMHDGKVVLSSNHAKGNYDPDPYYDDTRIVTGYGMSGTSGEGFIAELHLCSGQSNYWAEAYIYDQEHELIVETEPWESVDDKNEVISANTGETYILEVEWITPGTEERLVVMTVGLHNPVIIGAVMTALTDTELSQCWNDWRDEVPTPEADSDFVEWFCAREPARSVDTPTILCMET